MNTRVLSLLRKKLRFFSISSLLLAGAVLTAPVFAAGDAPQPPAQVESTQPDQAMPEDQVTIIQKKDTLIEEHRVNGQLRYAKITPSRGKPYYLYDSTGDGILDSRDNDLDNPPIQRWILFRW